MMDQLTLGLLILKVLNRGTVPLLVFSHVSIRTIRDTVTLVIDTEDEGGWK